jgi:hypothetical protein
MRNGIVITPHKLKQLGKNVKVCKIIQNNFYPIIRVSDMGGHIEIGQNSFFEDCFTPIKSNNEIKKNGYKI